ncbi:TAXI family TRAP transporter solute-binding subunit [Reyranella sp. MMS21-HV4-11]|jgi:TRAP transporter TAXI family solute receptor|uniref:TAXI family TRAP transporter solute-binding subunit n=1 Tax=Reyranella humidisoli TaxID=2849149 RepID=A0ABS6IP51_9HYPH|nr:TAXI family TRAP transporter solute-binding subunit [Reyranella sp. MMS21-HV4-11]MBU8875749.1 TAXI family TRAP transporter solute-binding subunit [Reyranella sp. MMS21-HV4-11]
MFRRTVATGAALALLVAVPAFGQAIPKEMSWTAYDTGSSGFNIAVAIGQQFKNVLGTDVRVLPSGNDTGRLAPVKANRAVISQMGIGTYFAQEGVFEFGTRSWGPQATRLIMAATACNGLGLAVAKDTGVKEVKDLKGKRLGIVVGSPALSQGVIALIAFGGLTEKDMTPVQFSSNNAMWKGLINNEVDALLTSTISGQSKEADSSPRGIMFPPMPATDKEGWARVHKKAPYFVPVKATCGAGGLSPQTPVEMAGYAYPIFMTYADRSADTIYAITKAMIDTFDAYKGGAPGAEGMALSLQNLTWVVPYHDGTIRAFKEKGVWTDSAQKHNDNLVKRQQVMIDAWKAYATGAPSDDKAFAEGWLKARGAALQKAGMDVVFE